MNRRLTITLRLSLVLVVGTVIALVVYQRYFNTPIRQLERVGSDVVAVGNFEYAGPNWNVTARRAVNDPARVGTVFLDGDRCAPHHVRLLSVFPNLYYVGLHGRVDDWWLVHLQECQALNAVILDSCAVTDRGLVHLAEIPSLRFLNIKNTNITEKGLTDFRYKRPDVEIYQ